MKAILLFVKVTELAHPEGPSTCAVGFDGPLSCPAVHMRVGVREREGGGFLESMEASAHPPICLDDLFSLIGGFCPFGVPDPVGTEPWQCCGCDSQLHSLSHVYPWPHCCMSPTSVSPSVNSDNHAHLGRLAYASPQGALSRQLR